MGLRIILDILLFLSVVLMPFWFTVIFALVLLFYFRNFWEAIPFFFFSDLLYGIPEQRFAGVVIVSLIIVVIAFILINALKKKLIVIQSTN